MAIFKFGPTNSVVNTVNNGIAFSSGVTGANSLIVDAGGFLIATGSSAVAADLNPFGPWTVTINGSVLATNGAGIRLSGLSSDFAPTAPPASTITIGKEGSVQGGISGTPIVMSRPAKVTNAGLIVSTLADDDAIVMIGQSAHTIINSGDIDGDIRRSGTGATTLTNTGDVFGNISLDSGNDVVSNIGHISLGVALGNGNNKLTNNGSIGTTLTSGSGNDTITNTGSIALGGSTTSLGDGNDSLSNSGAFARIGGTLDFGAGNDTFTNSGTTAAAIFMGGGNDTVTNSGTMEFGINLGSGINKLTNSGTIKTSFIGMGDEADTVINTGTIETDVNLGGGSNVLTNSKNIFGHVIGGANSDKVTNSGTITRDVVLGDGDDIYSATGKGIVFGDVIDGGGSDTYTFGASGGTFKAVGTNSNVGTDKITGGTSVYDYYSVEGSTTLGVIVINLDSKSHGAEFGFIDFAANTASGAEIGTDIVKGMDNVIGSNQTEMVFGTATSNALNGSGGSDYLFGLGGSDFIQGGSGSDVIAGGAGADVLFGSGSSAGDGIFDVFLYHSIADSGVTSATRDVIYDFEDGLDRIHLSAIDTDTAMSGVQAFHFIGMNVNWDNSGKGQLRSYWTAIGHIIEGDVNGDKKADFSIAIIDTDHSIAFDGSDFIL